MWPNKAEGGGEDGEELRESKQPTRKPLNISSKLSQPPLSQLPPSAIFFLTFSNWGLREKREDKARGKSQSPFPKTPRKETGIISLSISFPKEDYRD